MADEDFRSYWEDVLAGRWPSDPIVPLPRPFVNRQGLIQNLMLDAGYACVSVIESAPRSVRSNHYHREDSHFLYVVSGSMLYYERGVGEGAIPEPFVVSKRQMVFTPPMREHATAFLEPTTLLSISKRARDQESHESDVVRVEFLRPEDLGWR